MAEVQPITFIYRNYRGEVAVRHVVPHGLEFNSTEWHPEPQWLLLGFDLDKKAIRSFAMKDIMSWGEPEPVPVVSRTRRLFRAAFAAVTVPAAIYAAFWLLVQYLTIIVDYFRPDYGFYRALPFVFILAIMLPVAGIIAACAAYGSDD